MAPTVILITGKTHPIPCSSPPQLTHPPGANSGVGYAASKVLASASPDYHIIMTGRSLDKLNDALSSIQDSGDIKGTLSALQLDVTDSTSIRAAFDHVSSTHGHLDVLINNAAIGSFDPDPFIRFSRIMATNVTGPAVVSATFRPLLLKSQNPYSIYVSSGGGSLTRAATSTKVFDHEDAYRASKAAINMLAVVEQRDYGPEGIKTFAMNPGFVVSNLRGSEPEQRNPGGMAGDPMVSGRTILEIVEGKRDADVGKHVHKDGVHPW